MLAVATALAFLLPAAGADAATIGFDPDFGSGGPVLTPLGTPIGAADARANAIVPVNGGQLVAGGYVRDGRNNKFALARYNADGSLDTSFGTNGSVLTQVGLGEGSDDEMKALVVQPDGKLVGAGFSATGQSLFALARYNADGSLDTTFNPNANPIFNPKGTVLTGLGNASVARASALLLQPDGKLIAGGFARQSTTSVFALVRYNADASLDTTFGSGGKVLTPVGTGTFAAIRSMLLQADGKIVVAGIASAAGNTKFALARYNANGTLDTTFGSGGIVLTQVGQANATLNALVSDDSGGFVAAGSAQNGEGNVFALARYTANGTLDTTFGSGGTVLTPIGADNGATANALITDAQQLVAGGVASDGGVAQFAFARYDSDGSLDTTFNSSGTLMTPIGDGNLSAANALMLVDGRLLAAGYATNGGGQEFTLARYTDLPEVPGPGGGPAGPTASSCFQRLKVTICPGAPAAKAAVAHCRLQTKSVRMSRAGRVKVRLKCDAAARGTLSLSTRAAHKKSKKSKKKTRKLNVARSSFSLGKAASKTISVKLSKTARHMITSKKRLRVRVTVSARPDPAVKAAVTSASLTIRAAKR